jgi:hypothetical protein
MRSTRDKIEDIIEEFVSGVYDDAVGQREAADAILAALPDMIAPLVWSGKDYFWRSGKYTMTYYSGLEEPYKLQIGVVVTYYGTEAEAYAVANTHHRAKIMAAFQTPPTITP